MSYFIESFRKDSAWVVPLLESELPQASVFAARECIDKFMFATQGLTSQCETVGQLRALITRRYGTLSKKLEKLAAEPATASRFCKACAILKEAIDISIREMDISVGLSGCLSVGFGMLSEKLSYLTKSACDKILDATCGLFESLFEYNELTTAVRAFEKLGLPTGFAAIRKLNADGTMRSRVEKTLFREIAKDKRVYEGGKAFLAMAELEKVNGGPTLIGHDDNMLLAELWDREYQYFLTLIAFKNISHAPATPKVFKAMCEADQKRIAEVAKRQAIIRENKDRVRQDLMVFEACGQHWRAMMDAESDPEIKSVYRGKWEKVLGERLSYETSLISAYGLTVKDFLGDDSVRSEAASDVRAEEVRAEQEEPKPATVHKGRPKGSVKWAAGELANARLPEKGDDLRLWVDEDSVVHAIIDGKEERFVITSQKAGQAFAELFERCRKNFGLKMLTWGLCYDDNVRKMLQSKGAFERGLLVKLPVTKVRKIHNPVDDRSKMENAPHYIMINSEIFRGLPRNIRDTAACDFDLRDVLRVEGAQKKKKIVHSEYPQEKKV